MVETRLFAVVGKVQPRRLRAFLRHYAGIGVDAASIVMHIPGGDPESLRDLSATIRNEGAELHQVLEGPWDEASNSLSLAEARAKFPRGWHVVADVDEFHQHPSSLEESIEVATGSGEAVILGTLVDRFSLSGELIGLGSIPFDRQFPLGGFFTSETLKGDPRKVVACRPSIPLEIGQHWSRNEGSTGDPRALVHHFKWIEGVDVYLRERIRRFERGAWEEASPAMRSEARRFLQHLRQNGGRVDTTSLVRCSLFVWDHALFESAREVHRRWNHRFSSGTTNG